MKISDLEGYYQNSPKLLIKLCNDGDLLTRTVDHQRSDPKYQSYCFVFVDKKTAKSATYLKFESAKSQV